MVSNLKTAKTGLQLGTRQKDDDEFLPVLFTLINIKIDSKPWQLRTKED